VKKPDVLGVDRRIVWLDCEMTGLRIGADESERPDDEICEIGVIVTDGNLVPFDNGMTVVIKPSDETLALMNSYVRSMHTASGLLKEIPTGVSVSEAEKQVMEYVLQHVPEAGTAQIGGNTIHMDRRFLAKYMPTLDNHLHYRSVDASTIKELVMRWFPDVFAALPDKNGNHRALADAIESIRELDFYRTVLFNIDPVSGDDLDSAKAVVTEKWKKYLS
jgi:oligoribonuclease